MSNKLKNLFITDSGQTPGLGNESIEIKDASNSTQITTSLVRSRQLESLTGEIGVTPLIINSSVLVPNLNTEYLDGKHLPISYDGNIISEFNIYNNTTERDNDTVSDGDIGRVLSNDTFWEYQTDTWVDITSSITKHDLVGVSASQTLTNKTLTTPSISGLYLLDSSIVFEGTSDDYETTLTVTDPTADRTITLPNLSGTVAFIDTNQTITASHTVEGDTTFSRGTVGSPLKPFTLSQYATDLVTYLNADRVDSLHASSFVRSDVDDTVEGVLTFTDIPQFNGGETGTSAPFSVDSTNMVSNLNADLWDGNQFADYLNQDVKSSASPTFSGMNLSASGDITFEGGTDNTNETTLTVVDPTGDRTVSLPDLSGIVALIDTEQTISASHSFTGAPDFNTSNPTFTFGSSGNTTTPFVVSQYATDVVTNLNADRVDSLHASDFARSNVDDDITGTLTFTLGSDTIAAAPFAVSQYATSVVARLNADKVDDKDVGTSINNDTLWTSSKITNWVIEQSGIYDYVVNKKYTSMPDQTTLESDGLVIGDLFIINNDIKIYTITAYDTLSTSTEDALVNQVVRLKEASGVDYVFVLKSDDGGSTYYWDADNKAISISAGTIVSKLDEEYDTSPINVDSLDGKRLPIYDTSNNIIEFTNVLDDTEMNVLTGMNDLDIVRHLDSGEFWQYDLGTTSWSNITLDIVKDNLVGTNSKQTLLNKTLTNPNVSGLYLTDSSLKFEGSTSGDLNQTILTIDDSSNNDNIITLPDKSGVVAMTDEEALTSLIQIGLDSTGFVITDNSGNLSVDGSTYDNYLSWTISDDGANTTSISSEDTLTISGGTLIDSTNSAGNLTITHEDVTSPSDIDTYDSANDGSDLEILRPFNSLTFDSQGHINNYTRTVELTSKTDFDSLSSSVAEIRAERDSVSKLTVLKSVKVKATDLELSTDSSEPAQLDGVDLNAGDRFLVTHKTGVDFKKNGIYVYIPGEDWLTREAADTLIYDYVVYDIYSDATARTNSGDEANMFAGDLTILESDNVVYEYNGVDTWTAIQDIDDLTASKYPLFDGSGNTTYDVKALIKKIKPGVSNPIVRFNSDTGTYVSLEVDELAYLDDGSGGLDIPEYKIGYYVFVEQGDSYGNTGWVLKGNDNDNDNYISNTEDKEFVQYNGIQSIITEEDAEGLAKGIDLDGSTLKLVIDDSNTATYINTNKSTLGYAASGALRSATYIDTLESDIGSNTSNISTNASNILDIKGYTWNDGILINTGTSNPASGEEGEYFYNTSSTILYEYNGSSWVDSGISDLTSAPSSPSNLDKYYNTSDSKLYTYLEWSDETIIENDYYIGDINSLETSNKRNIVSAINEVDSHADNNASNISTNTSDISTNSDNIGTLSTLSTTNKGNVVSAINEVDGNTDTNTSNINIIRGSGVWDDGIVVNSGTSNPASGEEGEYFYNTANGDLYEYISGSWVSIITDIATSEPGNPSNGDRYITTGNSKLYTYLVWTNQTIIENFEAIGSRNDLNTNVNKTIVESINEVDAHADSNTQDIASINSDIGDINNLDTTSTDLTEAINEVRSSRREVGVGLEDNGTDSDVIDLKAATYNELGGVKMSIDSVNGILYISTSNDTPNVT
jgi:hypothetical protein